MHSSRSHTGLCPTCGGPRCDRVCFVCLRDPRPRRERRKIDALFSPTILKPVVAPDHSQDYVVRRWKPSYLANNGMPLRVVVWRLYRVMPSGDEIQVWPFVGRR